MASLNRLRRSTPAPSPITNPLALASKGVEWVGDNAPMALNFEKVAGSIVRSVAPASMTSTWRVWSKRHASKTAAIEDAHAASIAWLGPCKSSKLATRPDTTLANSPGIVSSSIRGAPSTNSFEKASRLPAGNPCFLATSVV